MGETTPGPWKAKGLDSEKIKIEGQKFGEEVCVIYNQANRYSGLPSQSRQANAHLIASAPDLLAALKALLESADVDFDGNSVSLDVGAFNRAQSLAKAAAAKAEGR
jgi:HPt (histidine-containing phosphotransfer) domain-containing protein